MDFPGGSDGKGSAYNAGDPSSIPGMGRSPGERNGNPLVSLPGESHGRRSLIGYSPWGCKESDMTEQFYFLLFIGGWAQTSVFLEIKFLKKKNK